VSFPGVEVGGARVTYNPSISLHLMVNFSARHFKKLSEPNCFALLVLILFEHKFRTVCHIVLYPARVSMNLKRNKQFTAINKLTQPNLHFLARLICDFHLQIFKGADKVGRAV
jgi:hypothetical protein